MHIGYESDTGHVYEGASVPEYPVVPAPILTLARLVRPGDEVASFPQSLHYDPSAWLLREESFDPVTKIRRGRLYERFQDSQPKQWLTRGHPANQFTTLRGQGLTKSLFSYWPCQSLPNMAGGGNGLLLALGQAGSWSTWRIVQVERLVGDDVLVTLKALSAFGIVPNLRVEVIPHEHRKTVQQAIERVIDSAFRDTAIAVIDQCRNAANVLLTRWMLTNGADASVLNADLGAAVKRVGSAPFNRFAGASAADLIRRLHPRGKSNEQEAKGLRLPCEEDAEASVHAVGFIMRELDWAA